MGEGDQAERRRKTGREAGEREIRLRDVERRGERRERERSG